MRINLFMEKSKRKCRNAFERMKINFIPDNRGVGIIEVVLIMVILIAVVLIFKDQIMDIINKAFNSITNDSSNIIN